MAASSSLCSAVFWLAASSPDLVSASISALAVLRSVCSCAVILAASSSWAVRSVLSCLRPQFWLSSQMMTASAATITAARMIHVFFFMISFRSFIENANKNKIKKYQYNIFYKRQKIPAKRPEKIKNRRIAQVTSGSAGESCCDSGGWGRSCSEVRPKWDKKASVVPYRMGRPSVSLRPTSSISPLFISDCTE